MEFKSDWINLSQNLKRAKELKVQLVSRSVSAEMLCREIYSSALLYKWGLAVDAGPCAACNPLLPFLGASSWA